ncbi:class I SAM-dependent methyltransferase [Oceanirhabdus sp. W0125-5]|uniref:class I SAM-dependent methyltransferase n=1 Tax=Oceanirhabdus sp. W0125-5 TaxID=2999116 RepID=UPI0022F3131F|nr:class I SAM-dependent methyltransferase [Oceanirhabdus sp. W0125-5]WBW98573.1 class I SAM-dependent methyltransferase [Oceanirhabdus sp. W0125-5]
MNNNNGWRMFFNNYAPDYMKECFTKNTVAEVDFIEEELKLPKGSYILDIGCGTGRHSIELARRGYNVTGIDISENMLLEGKKVCKEENLNVDFIHADATEFKVNRLFDACICLCEGAFGLLSMEEDPFVRDHIILENINSVLKPNSKFILTALNGMKMIRQYSDEDVDKGVFDPITIAEKYPLSNILKNAPEDILVKEKGFLPTELNQLLNNAGFKVENIGCGTAGKWNKHKLKLDDMELMLISKKTNKV